MYKSNSAIWLLLGPFFALGYWLLVTIEITIFFCKESIKQWYFVHIIFCFLYEENIFSCEWLVFWVRSGENSVLKKEKFWITSLRVIPSFSFWNTLFSPRVSQKNSHEQVKIVFFMRQQKIMWTDYFFQFFHGAFQCVSRIVP